jgi:hypothetical protein
MHTCAASAGWSTDGTSLPSGTGRRGERYPEATRRLGTEAAQTTHREHAWREHTGAGRAGRQHSSAYDLGSADRRRAGSIIYQARDGEESDLGSLAWCHLCRAQGLIRRPGAWRHPVRDDGHRAGLTDCSLPSEYPDPAQAVNAPSCLRTNYIPLHRPHMFDTLSHTHTTHAERERER